TGPRPHRWRRTAGPDGTDIGGRSRARLVATAAEERLSCSPLEFARADSLERVMHPPERGTAGCLSISVEPRATRLGNSPLPGTLRKAPPVRRGCVCGGASHPRVTYTP